MPTALRSSFDGTLYTVGAPAGGSTVLTDQELRHADLGDARLNRRLRAIADALTERPTAPIPEACAGAADQAYRFFDNPRATPGAIRDAHYADARARAADAA